MKTIVMRLWVLSALLTVFVLGAPFPVEAGGPVDPIELTVTTTGVPGQVQLSWLHGGSPFSVYRSTDAATHSSPGNIIGSTGASTFNDTQPSSK